MDHERFKGLAIYVDTSIEQLPDVIFKELGTENITQWIMAQCQTLQDAGEKRQVRIAINIELLNKSNKKRVYNGS